MLKIYYYSSGGNGFTKRLVDRLGIEAEQIPYKLSEAEGFFASDNFILICPTYYLSGVRGAKDTILPKQVSTFLNKTSNRDKLRATVSTGNMNFGDYYAISGEYISKKTGVPELMKVELSGSDAEIIELRSRIDKFCDK